ncbi:hypothetical protein [Corynebacterium aquatimens]|uniref:Redox-sensitive bicupin YhaK (Pirin superfamily) n=1 Tax=Corynebacterium aquatimens TaxID=1190508 RepID=A0A931E2J3_9CORY|nr:hypothetical protein [Corynebacterium aquatimens]MBG6122752.1 redox-sensitive bicupin YhaK (pirin superfamily) [Corynebacterium aquatimens]WJY66911.1 hypothetical protein CAQUA_11140 [Corynebacterium aquatimens]
MDNEQMPARRIGAWTFNEPCNAVLVTPSGVELGLTLDEDVAENVGYNIHIPLPHTLVGLDGREVGTATVFAGALFGREVEVGAPVEGAELYLEPNADFTVWVNRDFEHVLMTSDDGIELEETQLPGGAVGHVEAGRQMLHIVNTSSSRTTVILLGGPEQQAEEIDYSGDYEILDH